MIETEGLSWQQVDGTMSLVAATPERLAKAKKSWLSISAAHKVDQCPAAHLGSANLPRIDDPFSAATLGTGAHQVMEWLYQLPPEERTKEAAQEFATQATAEFWAEKPVTDVDRERWHHTVRDYALGIFQIEDPRHTDVIGTEWGFRGLPTSNGVVAVGYIDLVRRLPDGTIGIDDFKYGAWKGEPNPRFRDNYGMQGRLYKDVYETHHPGEQVSQVRLLYPREPHVRVIDISPGKVAETLTSFQTTRRELDGYVATGVFPTKPGPLCGWCDLARACPVARITSEKAKGAAALARSSQMLGIPGSRPDDPDLVARAAAVAAAAITAHRESDSTPKGTIMTDITLATEVAEPRPESYGKSATVGNGILDLGSYAARNASQIVDFAVWMIRDADYPVTPQGMGLFSTQLARLVRRVAYRYTGRYDLQSGAVSQALWAVKAAAKYVPAPLGGTPEEWASWSARVEAMGVAVMRTTDAVFADDVLELNIHDQLAAAFPAKPDTH